MEQKRAKTLQRRSMTLHRRHIKALKTLRKRVYGNVAESIEGKKIEFFRVSSHVSIQHRGRAEPLEHRKGEFSDFYIALETFHIESRNVNID